MVDWHTGDVSSVLLRRISYKTRPWMWLNQNEPPCCMSFTSSSDRKWYLNVSSTELNYDHSQNVYNSIVPAVAPVQNNSSSISHILQVLAPKSQLQIRINKTSFQSTQSSFNPSLRSAMDFFSRNDPRDLGSLGVRNKTPCPRCLGAGRSWNYLFVAFTLEIFLMKGLLLE